MNNLNELNDMHLDILKEIGNIGAGNAATALSSMLNKKVDMDVPKVRILEFNHVAEILGGEETPVVGILLNVTGEISGMMMFVVAKQYASSLINLLMGGLNEGEQETFSEIELSALQEVGNIITGAYLSSLSGLTNLKILPSVPYLAIDMAGAILSVPAIEFSKIGDKVLFIQSDFGEEIDNIEGYFILIPEMESFNTILKSLGIG